MWQQPEESLLQTGYGEATMNCMLHIYKIQSYVNTKEGATQTHKACFQSHKIQPNHVIKITFR